MDVADGLPPPDRWRAMLAVSLAVAMSVLVTSLANIALPTIAHDMHATPAASIWVVNAYQLAVTVTLLPFSSMGDIYGHRRVYVCGLAMYTAASLICATAPSLPVLVLGRVLQGFGGAGIMSVNGALVRFIYPRDLLGRGIGLNALVVAGSSAAGPSVAAAIMSVASWPWLFALQVPGGALALLLSLRFLPRTPRIGHPFDPLSAVLNAVTLGLFILGLDGIGRGQGAISVLVQLSASLFIGWFFVHRQFSLAAPMLPVDLFRRPVFALSVATAICAHAAQLIAFIALAVLLPVCQRPFADTDRRADHTVAGRPRDHGADRRPSRRSSFGGTAGRPGPRGDDAGIAPGAVHAASAISVERCLAAGGVRLRLWLLPVAEQPPDDRQRAA
jgi:DHA2 family multidrug resistance protein-like MFS transporter